MILILILKLKLKLILILILIYANTAVEPKEPLPPEVNWLTGQWLMAFLPEMAADYVRSLESFWVRRIQFATQGLGQKVRSGRWSGSWKSRQELNVYASRHSE